jgi:lysophospholipase L1-like esterase
MNAKIIFISISKPDQNMVKKNAGIIDNVNRYNNALTQMSKKHLNFFLTKPLEKNDLTEVYEDGYHPNKNGHDFIADEVSKILRICE